LDISEHAFTGWGTDLAAGDPQAADIPNKPTPVNMPIRFRRTIDAVFLTPGDCDGGIKGSSQ